MKSTIIKIVTGVIVTVGTLIFLVPLIDPNQLRAAFLSADPQWVIVGFLTYALAYFVRALRFRVFLPKKKIPLRSIVPITAIHGAAVRVFPNPFGELAFIGGVRSIGVGYAASVSALVAYRALDFAVVAVFLFFSAAFFVPATGMVAGVIAFIGGVVAISAMSIIAIASFYQEPLVRFLSHIEQRFPVRGTLIAQKGALFIGELRVLREERVYLSAVVFSVVVWLCMFATYGAFFKAVGVTVPLMALTVAGAVQIFVNTLPNIGGIGTMEAGWLAGFSVGGISSATILSGVIFVDVATLVGTIIFGVIGLLALWRPRFYVGQLRSRSLKYARVVILAVILIGVAGGSALFFGKRSPESPLGDVRFFETYPEVAVAGVWTAYREKIQKDGRTVDRDRSYLTTSEGQSYSLLRAVWMDDKTTFDQVLKWTNNNLGKRPNDQLFAWFWGENSDGKWDVMYGQDGMNTASDADQDIALALIFAAKRWNQDHYMEEAQEILADIWKEEVVVVKGNPYLVAGNWAKDEVRPTINPSYFSFAAYPIFAEVDPSHPWLLLKNTSYDVLITSTKDPLDGATSAGIPPDWVSLYPVTGAIMRPTHNDKSTNFSDDAFRILWRVALDWKWHRDPRPYTYLSEMGFFKREWRTQLQISSAYAHDGEPVVPSESKSVYAVLASSLAVVEPLFADEIFKAKVAPLYDADIEDLVGGLGYYAQNWVWFGMAMYTDNIPNLFSLD